MSSMYFTPWLLTLNKSEETKRKQTHPCQGGLVAFGLPGHRVKLDPRPPPTPPRHPALARGVHGRPGTARVDGRRGSQVARGCRRHLGGQPQRRRRPRPQGVQRATTVRRARVPRRARPRRLLSPRAHPPHGCGRELARGGYRGGGGRRLRGGDHVGGGHHQGLRPLRHLLLRAGQAPYGRMIYQGWSVQPTVWHGKRSSIAPRCRRLCDEETILK